jgi:hypothetical protein
MKTYLEILLILSFAGMGWGFTLNPFPSSYVSLVAASLLSSCALLVISWIWALGIGAGGYLANAIVVIVAAAGWALGIHRWRTRKVRLTVSAQQIILTSGIMFGITLIGLGPKIGSNGSIDMTLRVGPDAIGNVIGAQALLGNRTIDDLEQELTVGSNSQTVHEVVDPPSRKMYELLSFRSQVRGEFIVAGLRWGFSGATASFASLLGENHLWEIVASLPTIAAAAAALLIFELLSRRSKKMLPSALMALAIIGNMSLLQGWHEGGLAQAFAVSAIPIVMLYLWEDSVQKKLRALSVLLLAGVFASYSDLTIVLIAVLSIFLVMQFTTKQRGLKKCIRTFFDLVVLPFLIAAPFSIRFINYLPRRLQDSSVGGWSMARWPGILEVLGLFPSFMNNTTELIKRAPVEIVFMSVGNAVVLGIVLRMLIGNWKKTSTHMITATALVLLLVFLKSVWLDHATNYQYIKAIGCIAPLGLLSLSDLLLNQRLKHLASRAVLVALPVVCILMSLSYVIAYRNSSIRIDAAEQTKYVETRNFLDKFTVVAPARFETVLLSPFSRLDWMNRSAGGTRPIYRASLEKPLGLVVLEGQCKNWGCLRTVPTSQILVVSETIRLLKVCPHSRCIFEYDKPIPDDSVSTLNDLLRKWNVTLDQFYVISRSQ